MESLYRGNSSEAIYQLLPKTVLVSTRKRSNVQLEWILNAYQNPNAIPGEPLDPASADATMRELKRKANSYATAQRLFDGNIAEDALCEMLSYIAQSNILSNFDRARGEPRYYVNAILWRFTWREIEKSRCNRPQQLTLDIADQYQNPAQCVEFEELIAQCNALIGETLTSEVEHIFRNSSKSSQYSKTHRQRSKKWQRAIVKSRG